MVGSALSFYSRRRDMITEGLAASDKGSFSFYVGRKHVVALGGPAGRKTFYESRGLNLSAG
jgi:sterol 14-demethylase